MKRKKNVAIIGTGLIGGSMAYAIRKHKIAQHIIGVEKNKAFANRALELGIVDSIATLKEAVASADLVILAVPVTSIQQLITKVLSLTTTQTVIDVGSTKLDIVKKVADHPKRKNYVATHPMWGTEHSGPEAAQRLAFKGKAVVLCDVEDSDEQKVNEVAALYQTLGMHAVYMNAEEHDLHTAYISHISHITSFALANTVLHKEKQTNAIFDLASGGFESTVRLAKSNAAMWTPILIQNRKNILDVLMELEVQIAEFKKHLIQSNEGGIDQLIKNANKIKKILK